MTKIVHSIGVSLPRRLRAAYGRGSAPQRRLAAPAFRDSSIPADATGWVCTKIVAESCKTCTILSACNAVGVRTSELCITENAQFLRICRWLQLIHTDRLAPL